MNYADQPPIRPELRSAPAPGARPSRSVGRGRSLPSGRALLGSLLVTLAGVGLYLATVRASEAPMTTYVVAAADLPPQHRIVASDLRVVTMRLDANLGKHTFRTVAELVGSERRGQTTTLGPIRRGEFVQPGNVIATQPGGSGREMSFSVDRSRAVDGRLSEGERIDIVATTGSGASATTEIVLSNALIIHLSDTDSATSDRVTISVAIPDAAAELALSRAIVGSEIIVVRSNVSPIDGNRADDRADDEPAPKTAEAQP
jgi:Flp pilus assembly protein CpaB